MVGLLVSVDTLQFDSHEIKMRGSSTLFHSTVKTWTSLDGSDPLWSSPKASVRPLNWDGDTVYLFSTDNTNNNIQPLLKCYLQCYLSYC